MTFSSNNPNTLAKISATVLKIILSEGYFINRQKLKFLGPDNSCRVTGLVKNSSTPKFGIGNRKKRHMRAVMHSVVRGKFVDTQYTTESSVEGWLAYLRSVDAESFKSMDAYWEKLKEKFQLL